MAPTETGGRSDELELDSPWVPPTSSLGPIWSLLRGDVLCVTDTVNAESLVNLLVGHGISGVPVVTDDGKLVGIVSKTDLVRERYEGDQTELQQPEHPLGLEPGFHSAHFTQLLVRDLMTPRPMSVGEGTSLARAAALMAFEGVHRTPVVTFRDEVVGVLSTLDLLRWFASRDGFVLPDPTRRASNDRL